MRARLFAALLFGMAAVHGILGAHLADADTATLAIAGAGALRCWFATQVLGASIASYAVAGFATLGVVAPRSFQTASVLAGAACSFALAVFLRGQIL